VLLGAKVVLANLDSQPGVILLYPTP